MPWMHAYSHNATSSCGSVASRPATPSRAWIGSQKRDRSSFSTTAITRRTGWLGPTRSSGHCTHHRHLPAFRSPQAHRWLRFLHFRCCVSRAHAFAYSSHPGGKPHEKSNSASKKSQALSNKRNARYPPAPFLYLAPRAAAFDNRIDGVVAFDVMFDFGETV